MTRAAAPGVGQEVGRGLGVVEIGVRKHRSEALLLSVCSGELADAVPVEMIGYVLTVVLRVYFPKRLQVLTGNHLQPSVATGMTGEVGHVEHTAHQRDDDPSLQITSLSKGKKESTRRRDLLHQLVYLVERHDAVPAAHTTGHFAVAAAGFGEEVEVLLSLLITVVAPSLCNGGMASVISPVRG
jgi:hypothetical protein